MKNIKFSNSIEIHFNKLIKKIENLNFKKYYFLNNIDRIVNVQKVENVNFEPNYIYSSYNKKNYKIQILDLILLHFIIKETKRITVLEFGCGDSSLIISKALEHNKKKYLKYVKKNLRKTNLFQLHSVDSNKKYINLTKKKFTANNSFFYHSNAYLVKYNGEITSEFLKLPNICPDFIFIDGPHVLDVKGSVNGITFKTKDRTLTGCDILKIENFLLPGTIILLDGLTNYAFYLKNNLKRNWLYKRFENLDMNLLQLCDLPLGYLNKRQINFYKD